MSEHNSDSWLDMSVDDLAMAETLADNALPTWGICYHCQQAVEKAFKAVLISTGQEPLRTHNLVRLHAALDAQLCSTFDEEMLALLTIWSTQQRYPADLPQPTPTEAASALVFAQGIVRKTKELLAQNQ